MARIIKKTAGQVKPGISTEYLNNFAEKLIIDAGAVPSFKGFGSGNPYPSAICTSINQEVVHCLPDSSRYLEDGDIIGLDLGIKYPASDGLFTDMAVTVGVGKIGHDAKKLIKVTKNALKEVINKIKSCMTTGDLGSIIQSYVESRGYNVVRELVGHGVGYAVHESPQLPNFGRIGEGEVLKEGMVLALEPMVNIGGWQVAFHDNGWNVETADGSLSAHFEHTVVVTKNGCEIITK